MSLDDTKIIKQYFEVYNQVNLGYIIHTDLQSVTCKVQ